ncbi:pseudouridine-5'-phosphatase-like isoform X2, partial [Leptotrombidium deliense]
MPSKLFITSAYFVLNVICLQPRFSVAQQKVFKPVTHAVFDLDGTLIDTESCYKDAANAVTSRYGMEFTWENKSKLMGTNLRKNSDLIVNAFHLPMTGKEFYDEVMSEFSVLIKNVPFMPGAERIIQYFHSNNIPIGLCTASRNDSYYIKVEHFGDFFKPGNYFDVVVV